MVITGYAEMLHNDLSPGDPRRHDVDEIRNAAEGARSLTRQLLAFSRQQVIEPRVVELEAAVSNVEKMLRRLLGEDVHLVTQPNAQTSNVLIDPGQLEQIIMNMAVNARDAMASGGRFSISTSRVRIDEERARMHGLESAGTYALLTMSDTGIGMDAATMARIFEPFFTTKEVGKGTGLGLATVYGIVKRANGVLQVRSEPGQGATFEVYLPLVEGEVCPLVETTDKLPVGGRETVLLVEDAAPVRAITRRALESFGYSVLEASRGDLALDIARQHCGSIDLLLTDVVMPGMSGRELGEQLRQFCPRTKLLYMSGYTDDSVVRFGVKTAGLAYLEKPFTPDALAHKVRSVLDNEVPSAA
jgi:two-component system cell cycle sensor histidine kinase/response regulator CckA